MIFFVLLSFIPNEQMTLAFKAEWFVACCFVCLFVLSPQYLIYEGMLWLAIAGWMLPSAVLMV